MANGLMTSAQLTRNRENVSSMRARCVHCCALKIGILLSTNFSYLVAVLGVEMRLAWDNTKAGLNTRPFERLVTTHC